MKITTILTLLTAIIITSGCADRVQEKNRLSELEKRLGTIEDTNNKILTELESLKSDIDTTVSTKVDLAVKAGVEEMEARADQNRQKRNKRWKDMRGNAEERRGDMAERHINKFADDLDLNAEQKERIKDMSNDIKKKIQKAITNMHKEGAFNVDTMRKAMTEMEGITNEHMRDILSAEQFRKYETLPNPLKAMNNFFNPGHGRHHQNNKPEPQNKEGEG